MKWVGSTILELYRTVHSFSAIHYLTLQSISTKTGVNQRIEHNPFLPALLLEIKEEETKCRTAVKQDNGSIAYLTGIMNE